MKKVNILFISLAFIFLSSCTSTHLNQKYTYLNKVPVNAQVDNNYATTNKVQNQTEVTNNKLFADKINDNISANHEISNPSISIVTTKSSAKKQFNFNKTFNSFKPFTRIEANHFKQQLNTVDNRSIVDINTLTKVLIGLLILSLILVILDLILPGNVFSIISTIILILILIYGIYFLFQLL